MRRGYAPHTTDGTFEPRFIPKHERRSTGSDDRILALYARGMTVREIQGFLADMYAVEVSPDLIRTVTDGIVAEVTAWQSRPRERLSPVVFFDALRSRFATKRPSGARRSISRSPCCSDGHREDLHHERTRKRARAAPEDHQDPWTLSPRRCRHQIDLAGALRNITATWERTSHHWRAAMNQFAILYEGRFTNPAV